MTEKLLPSEN